MFQFQNMCTAVCVACSRLLTRWQYYCSALHYRTILFAILVLSLFCEMQTALLFKIQFKELLLAGVCEYSETWYVPVTMMMNFNKYDVQFKIIADSEEKCYRVKNGSLHEFHISAFKLLCCVKHVVLRKTKFISVFNTLSFVLGYKNDDFPLSERAYIQLFYHS